MKKKLFASMLAAAMILSLASCGGSSSASSSAPASSPADSASSMQNNGGSISVDEGIFYVDVTMPAGLFEGEDMTEFDGESWAKDRGYKSAVLNEDGSVTVTMTKDDHKTMVDEMGDSFDETLQEMVGSEDYPFITAIERSSNFEEVNIKVNKAAHSQAFLDLSPLVAGLSGCYYQAVAGIDISVTVNTVDDATGEVISSTVYPVEGDAEATSSNAEKLSAGRQENSGDVGDYHIDITGAYIGKDYENNHALIVSYDWTNNSEETVSASTAVYEVAFQDGVQLDTAIVTGDSNYDSDASWKDVRPGTTITVQKAFVLTSDTSVVEFEVSEWLTWDSNPPIVYKNFDLGAL